MQRAKHARILSPTDAATTKNGNPAAASDSAFRAATAPPPTTTARRPSERKVIGSNRTSLGFISGDLFFGDRRSFVVAERAADVRDHVGNVGVGERAFPGRHLAVVRRAVDGNRSVQAAQHDADDFLRIAGDDRIIRQRRKRAGQALTGRAVTRRAVRREDFRAVGACRPSRSAGRALPPLDAPPVATRPPASVVPTSSQALALGSARAAPPPVSPSSASCAKIESPTIAMTMIVAPHKIPLREPKLRVVLRSIHGIASTTIRRIVGTMIVAISSTAIGAARGSISAGTSPSNPKSERKYHAGYGTNCEFVGSAFASRNGGKTSAKKTMTTKTKNEAAASMNI